MYIHDSPKDPGVHIFRRMRFRLVIPIRFRSANRRGGITL